MEESLTASAIYDLIITLSSFFVKTGDDLDFFCCTNLFGLELEDSLGCDEDAIGGDAIAGDATAGEATAGEATAEEATAEEADILFQTDTNVDFGGCLPHLATIAANPDIALKLQTRCAKAPYRQYIYAIVNWANKGTVLRLADPSWIELTTPLRYRC